MNERFRGKSYLIKWNDWNEEIFEKAKNENKPILLSLSAIWCHWCHVMDETTYSDEEIINLINENFIPVRVDVDKRPDIAERYNFGGYPTFAFLNYKGEILAGGTYLPPQHFKEVLKDFLDLIKKEGIKELPSYYYHKREKLEKGEVNEKIIWDITDIVIYAFDNVYGGFGSQMKFPLTDAILFVENMYFLTKKEGFKNIFIKTLDGILKGLFDKEEGGFFRYSVTRDWLNPHFEKMLDVNSNLIKCFSFAYYLTNINSYKDSVYKTIDYLMENLYDRNFSLFYGSQDADEEYYNKNLYERKNMKKPIIDKSFYACFNSLCSEALFYAGYIFNDKNLINISKNILEDLINYFLKNDLFYHELNSNLSLLNDNVFAVNLLNLFYQYTFNNKYLELANKILNSLLEKFFDGNLFRDRIIEEKDFGLLKEPYYPILENSLLIKAYFIVGELLNNQKYKEISSHISSILSKYYLNYDIFSTSFANSLLFYLNPIEIRLIYNNLENLKDELNKSYLLLNPLVYIKFINYNDVKEEYKEEGIYICYKNVCYSPIKNINSLNEFINNLIKDKI